MIWIWTWIVGPSLEASQRFKKNVEIVGQDPFESEPESPPPCELSLRMVGRRSRPRSRICFSHSAEKMSSCSKSWDWTSLCASSCANVKYLCPLSFWLALWRKYNKTHQEMYASEREPQSTSDSSKANGEYQLEGYQITGWTDVRPRKIAS